MNGPEQAKRHRAAELRAMTRGELDQRYDEIAEQFGEVAAEYERRIIEGDKHAQQPAGVIRVDARARFGGINI